MSTSENHLTKVVKKGHCIDWFFYLCSASELKTKTKTKNTKNTQIFTCKQLHSYILHKNKNSAENFQLG